MVQNSSDAADLQFLFDELFPICRSITGHGIRQSLGILSRHIDLKVESVPTGTSVLDWTVPEEWELRRARLIGPDGKTVVDTRDSNLHVLNFSEPFVGEMDLDALQPHLYSDASNPDAIPYVTSYHVPRWGLCLPHAKRMTLRDGRYRIEIDTEKRSGNLNYGVCDLQGESSDLILLTSYLCHPSIANNELSGPLALVRIWEALSSLNERRFSYRFLLIPETIGSITYLAKHGKELQKRLYGGVVLTCLGGPKQQVSFKLTRRDWVGSSTPIDRLARHLAEADPTRFAVRPFTPTGGSDERQFCSQGFDLPMIQAARTIYGEYSAYHTSADDLEFMTIPAVERSAGLIFVTLMALEVAETRYVNLLPHGEPQLGRRGLYPSLNGPMTNRFSTDSVQDGRQTLNQLLCLLSLADGSRTLIEIAEHIGASVLDLAPIARHLSAEGLLKEVRE